MNITDMVKLGLFNLKQRKLRTFLTTLGVIVGIGALSSMVSFGTGLQKNISDSFSTNDLFTSLRITAKKIDLNKPASVLDSLVPLSDSILTELKQIKELTIVFPELIYPAKVELLGKELTTDISGIPHEMGNFPPFSNLLAGSFYLNDSVHSAVLDRQTLKRLNILLSDGRSSDDLKAYKSDKNKIILPADSLIGKKVKIKTVVINPNAMSFGILGFQTNELPLKDTITEIVISGIVDIDNSFSNSLLRGGLILPFSFANSIPHVNINSTRDFLKGNKANNSFSSLYAKAKDVYSLEIAKKQIKKLGLEVFSMGDQFAQIKRSFLIMDALLGAIGLIALFVASLGIVNTMVMSILERTREIGIMKAIGASNLEIKLIFFVEASVIGFMGGVFGLILGWFVTRLSNFFMNIYLRPLGEATVNLFYFPVWLLLGSLLFSIALSLLAGLYPAIRASRIDPVKALRHD